MAYLSSWILSILGIIIISLIVEIVLPTGKTSKLIKSILGIFSIFTIISPLKEIDFNSFDEKMFFNEIKIDSAFIQKRNEEILEEHKEEIINSLNENGYLQIKVDFDVVYLENSLKINNIFVDLREFVLKSESLNINKYTNIMAIIKNIINIEEDKIIFYE